MPDHVPIGHCGVAAMSDRAVVVRFAVLPAAEQNANPFESQGPYRGVVLFRSVAVRPVKGLGPLALWNRLAGKLVEGLAGEVLTGPADAHPVDLATANVHGSDTAVALHLEGGLVAFPTRAEGGDEAGHGGAAGAGKGSKDGGVGMTGDQLIAATFQASRSGRAGWRWIRRDSGLSWNTPPARPDRWLPEPQRGWRRSAGRYAPRRNDVGERTCAGCHRDSAAGAADRQLLEQVGDQS